MQIPADLLAEKNYSGTRLIKIIDPKVIELKAELKKLQEQEMNPVLDGTEPLLKILDPYFAKMTELQTQISKLKEDPEVINAKSLYDIELKRMEEIDIRGQLIKNKIEPILKNIVMGQLGEFERAKQIIEKDGEIYVEVADDLEEKIKSIRAKK